MRNNNKLAIRPALLVGGVIAVAALGLVAGGAVAASLPPAPAPAGLSAADSSQATTPMPAPSYAKNSVGQTYGSALKATSSATEPDLIQAVADNGKVGYVKKIELDAADGTTAAESFKSPADAIAWQEGEGAKDHTVNVYTSDGVTVIGTFTVIGVASQAASGASSSK